MTTLITSRGGRTPWPAVVLSVFAFVLANPAFAQTPSLLQPDSPECHEGQVLDIAAQPNFASATTKRAWVAQGCIRASFRLSDAQRMFAEDRTFTDYTTPHLQLPIAVEVDDTNARLYTLTGEGVLYGESISTPSSPTQFASVNLMNTSVVSPAFYATEYVTDLKVWGPSHKVVVATSKRLLVFTDTGSALTLDGQCLELYNFGESSWLQETPANSAVDNLKVARFERLRLQVDQNNDVMAYMTALMAGYGVSKPIPHCVVIARLGPTGTSTWSAPTLDWDSGSNVRFRVFNPLEPTYPPQTGLSADIKNAYTAHDIDVAVTSGGSRLAYVGCGSTRQIVQLDVTNSFSSGITEVQTFTSIAGAGNENVMVDPANAARVFALTIVGFAIIDTSSGTSNVLSEPFGFGCPHDMAYVARTSLATVWVGLTGQVDHIHKILNVTPATPTLIKEFFGISSSDGCVALAADRVYLPTFGGVCRYAPTGTGGSWQPDYASYQPAEVPVGSGNTRLTEHIATGSISGIDRLLTAQGRGGFLEFVVDPVTGNPAAPAEIAPSGSNLPSGWPTPTMASTNYYGNDVTFLVSGTHNYVLTDLSNTATDQIALLVYHYDTTNGWQLAASATSTAVAGTGYANTISVLRGTNAIYAFVDNNKGFSCFQMTGLGTGTPVVTLASQVNPGIGPTCGLVATKDRLFVSHSAQGTNPYELRIYAWDVSTGVVTATPVQSYGPSFFAASGASPGRMFRARFQVTNSGAGLGNLFLSSDGFAFQCGYDGGTSPNTLTFLGWWTSDHASEIQDTQVYDFGAGPKVLIAKNTSSFAWVVPN
jgi:hypothetical protein